MITLQVDQGNSALKWRLVEHDACLTRGVVANEALPSDGALTKAVTRAGEVWIASVASDETRAALRALCAQSGAGTVRVAHSTARCGDLVNSYEDPKALGVDRWLAMVGARARCSNELCVVDVGSALTIDFVAKDGEHRGGYILPGLELMQQALRVSTARVRYSEFPELSLAPGRSTAEAVSHGIALAMVGSIEAALRAAPWAAPQLFLTGGSGAALKPLLSVESIAVDDLVLEGLAVAVANGCSELVGSD